MKEINLADGAHRWIRRGMLKKRVDPDTKREIIVCERSSRPSDEKFLNNQDFDLTFRPTLLEKDKDKFGYGTDFLLKEWNKYLEANPHLLEDEDRDNRKILLKEGLETFQK